MRRPWSRHELTCRRIPGRPLALMVGELWGRRLEKEDVITVGSFRNINQRCLSFEALGSLWAAGSGSGTQAKCLR